ncbi:MAG TPA: peptidogalycan biosysnthesis protein, partial [Stellaceae bacterium]|nr:peptidogalycan biosysnthesis protein [Stellaceae bacterium]
MNEGPEPISVTVHGTIREIPAAEWDACAGDINPTVSHAFLSVLEESGSATARAGWAPQHLALAGPGGRLVGAVPMYLKSHSYGEYVFDWGWADAYERAGGRYYPKLLCAVPFTPVPGPRLLVAPDAPTETRLHLVAGMIELARQRKLSSLHVNFPEPEDFEAFEQAGFLPRIGQQFHWANDGYRDFDDFLGALASRKRKQIKRERREALGSGIAVRVLTGAEIEKRHWDAFFR